MKQRLDSFATIMIKPDFESLATQISKVLNQNVDYNEPDNDIQNPKSSVVEGRKSFRRPSMTMFSLRADILSNLSREPSLVYDVDPNELARQITLLEHGLFSKIKGHELLDQIWSSKRTKELQLYQELYNYKPSSGQRNSNVSEFIQHTNDASLDLI